MTSAAAGDLLDTIIAAAHRAVAVRSTSRPLRALERDVKRSPAGAAFQTALRDSAPPRVIAECKRRSPSRGILRQDYRPALHAAAYEAAGAAAISVLTEPTFFDGSPEHLREVRGTVTVPLLRKDFIVTEYQIVEAAALGADAVLLIAGAVDEATLATLIGRARALGLAALVEVHHASEIARAVDAGAGLIGVNSRNLRTLAVNPTTLEAAAERLPTHVIRVAESGLRTPSDLNRLSALGYHAFLVGEQLITQPDPGAALRELRREGHPA